MATLQDTLQLQNWMASVINQKSIMESAKQVFSTKTLDLADQFSQSLTKLDLMNQRFSESGNLQQKIYESAQRSRSTYQSTADTVLQLGTQAHSAFSSTDEVVAFTEQVNKSFAIAGASTKETDAAMKQLIKAMSEGTLKGDSLTEVLKNNEPVVQNIADYMGVPIEEMKKLASEGAVTSDVIKNAMFAAANETNDKLNSLPMTFSQAADRIRNKALVAFQPLFQQLSQITKSDSFQGLVTGVLLGIEMLAAGVSGAMNLMGQAAQFVQENLWLFLPIIGALTGAVIVYQAAVVVSNIAQGISNAKKAFAAILAVAHGNVLASETVATGGLTAAQINFNAALLACPLTWIVLAIIALIAVIFIAVAAINHFAGTSYSAVGVVFGVFAALGAYLYNSVVSFWNVIAALVNFLFNVFFEPVASIKMLFYQLALSVIGYMVNMAHAIEDIINNIPGVEVNITAGLDNLKNNIEAAAEEVKDGSQWIEVIASKEYLDYSDTYGAAYSKGERFENDLRDRFKGLGDDGSGFMPDEFPFDGLGGGGGGGGSPVGNIAGNTGQTAANTAAMADSMDIIDEDLKYMRDAAEQEIINRFTLAELKVDVQNNNTLTKKTDFSDMGSYLASFTDEILATAAERGHI